MEMAFLHFQATRRPFVPFMEPKSWMALGQVIDGLSHIGPHPMVPMFVNAILLGIKCYKETCLLVMILDQKSSSHY